MTRHQTLGGSFTRFIGVDQKAWRPNYDHPIDKPAKIHVEAGFGFGDGTTAPGSIGPRAPHGWPQGADILMTGPTGAEVDRWLPPATGTATTTITKALASAAWS